MNTAVSGDVEKPFLYKVLTSTLPLQAGSRYNGGRLSRDGCSQVLLTGVFFVDN